MQISRNSTGPLSPAGNSAMLSVMRTFLLLLAISAPLQAANAFGFETIASIVNGAATLLGIVVDNPPAQDPPDDDKPEKDGK